MVYKNGYVGRLRGQGQTDEAPKGVSFSAGSEGPRWPCPEAGEDDGASVEFMIAIRLVLLLGTPFI